MKVTIEIPQIKDFTRVNELAKQVHEMHVKWRPDLFLSVDKVISEEDYKEMIQEKEIYVAKIENNIIGYITLNIKESVKTSMRYRKVLSIEAICVDEKKRGKGIGSLLLKQAKKIGKENNCTDMNLTANEENTNAIKLYESFGFKVKNIAYSMQI